MKGTMSATNSSHRRRLEGSEADSKALWIGFDDEDKVKNPFKDKPALKSRQTNNPSKTQQNSAVSSRSKSAKDNFTIMSTRLAKRSVLKAKEQSTPEKP